MHVIPVGADALLVEVSDAIAAATLAQHARSGAIRVREVVPAARTVLFDGVDPDALRCWLDTVDTAASTTDRREVVVDVHYDGEDLDFVADHWGCSPDELIERHTGTDWLSVFCGFAPGFAYLAARTDLPSVPRLDDPRPRVAAGSVALADVWCGVYPTASPGGWRVIGHTEARLWDVTGRPPALLAPGASVRFRAQ